MNSSPAWLDVQSPRSIEPIPSIHAGEEAAICLALEIGADVLLIDDFEGRQAASRLGVPILGTLGVLEQAASAGLVDLDDAIRRIRESDFRASERIIQAILDRHRAQPKKE